MFFLFSCNVTNC